MRFVFAEMGVLLTMLLQRPMSMALAMHQACGNR